MTNLRHLVFLEKKLISIENKDGTNLNISNIVDVAGDDLFLFLLESTGVVWICYKPWVKFDETTHLRFIYFKTFEYEATNIFYCPLKHILIVIGREHDFDSMLKFNSYDLLLLMNSNDFEQTPQFIQSTPLFPNLNEFRHESNLKIAISDCSSIVAISTEFNGIYVYRNYIIPSDDQKLWVIPFNKMFKDTELIKDSGVVIKNIHIFTLESIYYLFVLTDYEIVSYNLTENSLVFRECSDAKFEVSCKLKNNLIAVYKSNKILIYHLLKGLTKQINTNNDTNNSNTNNYDNSNIEDISNNSRNNRNNTNNTNRNNNNMNRSRNKTNNNINNKDENVKLYCYNEYVINCNIDNIFDSNNIILINVYSYLLDITFIAYSYYIPRLIYVVQAMNNLYLFTTNSNSANASSLTSGGSSINNNNKALEINNNKDSNILIFELKNKRIYERIEILIKKRLFKWAIKLAEFEKRPKTEVEEIYKIYADWLYSKNRFNEAIKCYCKSGSSVEPCYVIQRFLVLNSKLYLYKYLYYLHMNNKDNYILTILLIQSLNNLNYNNMNNNNNNIELVNNEDSELLDDILDNYLVDNNNKDNKNKNKDNRNKTTNNKIDKENKENENEEKKGDADNGENIIKEKELYRFLDKFGSSHKKSIKEAITECRNTNKFSFASLIASYQNDSEELLNILIEDLNDFESAYELLGKVNNNIKYKIITKHHKLLLDHDPNKLLELIELLFTNNDTNNNNTNNYDNGNNNNMNRSRNKTNNNINNINKTTNNKEDRSNNMSIDNRSGSYSNTYDKEEEEENEDPEEYKIDNIVNTFVLENEFLLRLFEIVNKSTTSSSNRDNNNSLLLYTIRLNLLLQQYNQMVNKENNNTNNNKDSNNKENNNTNNNNKENENEEKKGDVDNNNEELVKIEDNILKLLNSNNNNKNELISLLLCLLYNYKRGSIAMSIKMGHYNFPLILLDQKNESFDLVEYVLNYGYNEPVLYLNILKLLLKYNNYIIIKKLLYNIQNYKLLKYQNIISIFNNYQHIQFQYIHDYIRNEFKKINDVILEYNNDIKQDKVEYINMKKNLVNLNNNYIIINNINCSSCGLHLEYPSIHFYCKHSYHIYCITQDNVCPKCSYNLPDNNDNDDNFFKFLIGSNDPFNYISQQFNKFLNI